MFAKIILIIYLFGFIGATIVAMLLSAFELAVILFALGALFFTLLYIATVD